MKRKTAGFALGIAAVFLMVGFGISFLSFAEEPSSTVRSAVEKYAKSGTSDSVSLTITHRLTRSGTGGIDSSPVTKHWRIEGLGTDYLATEEKEGYVPTLEGIKITCTDVLAGSYMDFFEPIAGIEESEHMFQLKLGTTAENLVSSCYRPFRQTINIENSNDDCENSTKICLGRKKVGYENVANEDGSYNVLDENVCQKLSIIDTVGAAISPTIVSMGCFNIYRPYKYNLKLSINTGGLTDMIYPGIDYTVSATTKNENDDGIDSLANHSASPVNTATYVFATRLNNDIDISSVGPFGNTTAENIDELRGNVTSRAGSIIQEETISGQISANGSQNVGLTLNVSDTTPLGSKICVVAATNYTSSSENTAGGYGTASEKWQTTNFSCYIVGTPSFAAVENGGVFSDDGISASIKNSSSGKIYGSWTELGAISNGAINGFASGNTFFGGYVGSDTSVELAPMTIKNTVGIYGEANILHSSIRDKIFYRFANPTTLAQAGGFSDIKINITEGGGKYVNFKSSNFAELLDPSDPDAIDKNRYTYATHSGEVSIFADSTLGGGSSGTSITHIIYAKGDVRIESDLLYHSGPYVSAFKLPQLLILAEGNIYINSDVREVDAWLVSNKTVYTCAEVGGVDCAAYHLRINGPVLANDVSLKRVYSDVADPSFPSETINLTASSLYWANTQAELFSNPMTTYLNELAPRK